MNEKGILPVIAALTFGQLLILIAVVFGVLFLAPLLLKPILLAGFGIFLVYIAIQGKLKNNLKNVAFVLGVVLFIGVISGFFQGVGLLAVVGGTTVNCNTTMPSQYGIESRVLQNTGSVVEFEVAPRVDLDADGQADYAPVMITRNGGLVYYNWLQGYCATEYCSENRPNLTNRDIAVERIPIGVEQGDVIKLVTLTDVRTYWNQCPARTPDQAFADSLDSLQSSCAVNYVVYEPCNSFLGSTNTVCLNWTRGSRGLESCNQTATLVTLEEVVVGDAPPVEPPVEPPEEPPVIPPEIIDPIEDIAEGFNVNPIIFVLIAFIIIVGGYTLFATKGGKKN